MKVGKKNFSSITEAVSEAQATGDDVISKYGRVIYSPKSNPSKKNIGEENKRFVDSLTPENRHRILSGLSKSMGIPVREVTKKMFSKDADVRIKSLPRKNPLFSEKKPSSTSHALADTVFEKYGSGVDFDTFKREYKKLEGEHTLKDSHPSLHDLRVMHKSLSSMGWKYPVKKNGSKATTESSASAATIKNKGRIIWKSDKASTALSNYNKILREHIDSGRGFDLQLKIGKEVKVESKSVGKTPILSNPKNSKSKYSVKVGTLGFVYQGGSKSEAEKIYSVYVKQRKADVTLIEDGKLISFQKHK